MKVVMAYEIFKRRILVDEYGYTDSDGSHHCADTEDCTFLSDKEIVDFITSKVSLSTDSWTLVDLDIDL